MRLQENEKPCDFTSANWWGTNPDAQTLQIRDLREFAAVITGKKRPNFSFEHDLSVQETLLRASGMWAGKR